MIDYNRMEKFILRRCVDNRANEIIKYVKSLIAKEFKLVASGKITRECGDLDIFFIDEKQINMMFKKYDGKNIEIYIRVMKWNYNHR